MDDKSINHYFNINAENVTLGTDGPKIFMSQHEPKRKKSVGTAQEQKSGQKSDTDSLEKLLKHMTDDGFQKFLKQKSNSDTKGLLDDILGQVEDDGFKKFLKQMISSNSQEASAQPPKTVLGRALTHEETTEKLHTSGKFHQAIGVHECNKKLTSSQRDLGFLIRYCLSLMLTKRNTRSKRVFEKIMSIIFEMGETFDSVLSLAKKTVDGGKNFEAIMLCICAANMADPVKLTAINSANKSKCMVVIREAVGNVSRHTKKATPFIRRYCVEAVRPLFEDVIKTGRSPEIGEHLVELKIATFHCMEILQLHADDDVNRVTTLERALNFLKDAYGPLHLQRKWFGNFSHNLGITYLKLNRHGDAAQMLSQAYEVFSNAIDFDNETEKQSDISKTRDMLMSPNLSGLVAFD